MDNFHKFINYNLNGNPRDLRLKYHGKSLGFDVDFAITQIEARQKTRNKIPTLLKNENFMFPNSVVAEQCTNEIIARFHASLVPEGSNVLDITAGLCVDSFYISQHSSVTAIEIDQITAEIDTANMRALEANVKVINADCVDFINSCDRKFDIIFADPARRDKKSGERVTAFEDCLPNILEMRPRLKQLSRYLIIKASSMVDITKGLQELEYVSDVWIVGIGGECKELLFKLDFEKIDKSIEGHIVEFDNKGNLLWDITYDIPNNESAIIVENIKTDDTIYEPSACVLKSGAANSIANKFRLKKIHNNSHLYISDDYHNDFPGRVMSIYRVEEFHTRNLKSLGKEYPKLNITTRNFPLTAQELRNKMKCKDGGNDYMFATTMEPNRPILIFCKRQL